ncbi:MAG: hypothetical protein ACI8VZ_000865, partial [Candidatus Paceibacteria bacterium]
MIAEQLILGKKASSTSYKSDRKTEQP